MATPVFLTSLKPLFAVTLGSWGISSKDTQSCISRACRVRFRCYYISVSINNFSEKNSILRDRCVEFSLKENSRDVVARRAHFISYLFTHFQVKIMPSEGKKPPWVYVNEKPTTDKAYFENLTRCIFQAGLSWKLMASKWSNFKIAFDDFIVKVSAYGLDKIKRLSENPDIIRNKQKINATIQNAREFLRIAEEYGSFKEWLDSLDKSNNYRMVVKNLSSRLKRIGPSTAHIFLWSVGEPIAYDSRVFTRKPTTIV